MRFVAAMMAGLALSGSQVHAQGIETGWQVQFYRDTFEETLFPVAVVQEIGDGISRAAFGFVCNGQSGLAATFTPSGLTIGQDAVSVAFRIPSGQKVFRFEPKKVPNFGGRRIADREETDMLIAGFTSSPTPISFRADQKQGQIPTTGAAQAIETLKGYCPK